MARKEFETLTPQMFYILLSLYEPLMWFRNYGKSK